MGINRDREMELVLCVTQVGDTFIKFDEISRKMVGLSGWGVSEQGWRKGPWTTEEDKLLSDYVTLHGEGRWSSVARCAGLNRSGKSCRLRWVNYLRPGLKRGQLTPQEEGIIIELHALWGNKWSAIARCLPGRTDNEIKNYWRTHFKNKAKASLSSEEKPKTKCMRRELLKQKQQEEHLKSVQTQMEMSSEYQESLISSMVNGRQDTAFSHMYPPATNFFDDQYLPRTLFPDGASSSDSVGDHDQGLWGGLWNLDDVCAQLNHPFLTNNKKVVSVQNQFPPPFN